MARLEMGKASYRFQDIISLILAALLFVAPWGLGYSGNMVAARSSWACAVVIAILAIAAIVQFAEWEEWVNLLVGLAVIAAPWVMGFTDVTRAVYAHYALGILVVAACVWELWDVHHPTPHGAG